MANHAADEIRRMVRGPYEIDDTWMLEQLDVALAEERDQLSRKARHWHKSGMLSQSEYDAVLAVLTVDSITAARAANGGQSA